MTLIEFREATKEMNGNLKIELYCGDFLGIEYLPLVGLMNDGEMLVLEGGEQNDIA